MPFEEDARRITVVSDRDQGICRVEQIAYLNILLGELGLRGQYALI